MNNRQTQILEAIINEYQKTGQPVASQVLVQNYNFNVSPATIRSEMLDLDKQGLLEQPHHSAGRIPTTKTYRLFVSQLLKEEKIRLEDQEKVKKNLQQLEMGQMISYQLAKMLAEFSHNLGMSGSFEKEPDFHEAGLSWLLQDFESHQPEYIVNILRGFDELENEFRELFKQISKEVEVFIGEENPIDDFKECSLVASGYRSGLGKGFIGILGPKRMNYARNIFLIKETKKIIEKKLTP